MVLFQNVQISPLPITTPKLTIIACMMYHCSKSILIFLLQNAISDENGFQQLILGVVCQEVIPDFKVLQDLESNTGKTSQTFKKVIKHSVDHLKLCSSQDLTAKQTFCWGLVASSSSHVHVTDDNFEWLHNYSYVISELGKLFNTYCDGKWTHRLIIDDLPGDIVTSRCNDVIRYNYNNYIIIHMLYIQLYMYA